MAIHKGSEEFQNDMKDFEIRLKQIRAEYNQYLGGNLQAPPNFSVAMVRKIIRKYAGDRTLRGTQKFQYYNLVAKFNTMMEFYNRRIRDRDDGKQTTFGYIKNGDKILKNLKTKGSGSLPMGHDRGHIVSNVSRQHATLRNMFDKWNEFSSHSSTAGPEMDFDQFKRIIGHQTEKILEKKNCKAVKYKLTIKDGKVKIQAKPIK